MGWKGTVAGARHDAVGAFVQQVVDGCRRGRGHANAQRAPDQGVERNHARRGQRHANQGGENDQGNNAKLAQAQKEPCPLPDLRSCRSEERRVGKECRSRWSSLQYKNTRSLESSWERE